MHVKVVTVLGKLRLCFLLRDRQLHSLATRHELALRQSPVAVGVDRLELVPQVVEEATAVHARS